MSQPTAYSQAAELMRLVGVEMQVLVFEEVGRSDAPSLTLDMKRNISDFIIQDNLAGVEIEFQIECHTPDRTQVLWLCASRWRVTYAGVRDADPDAVFEVCQRVGTMTAYPYVRNMVATACAATGRAHSPLPTVSIGTFGLQPRDQVRRIIGSTQGPAPAQANAPA